ncbi:MAG: hypothetical protein Roseis2KO_48780 [Roseivirga sp.]
MSFVKEQEGYGEEFTVENLSINSFNNSNCTEDDFENYFKTTEFSQLHSIAISAYVWNDRLTNPLISYLRKAGFNGKIVLGGYQITYGKNEQLKYDYPDCDIFISGYAESSLLKSLDSKRCSKGTFIHTPLDFERIPSPYLSNELSVRKNQGMVRMETKRGCPYRCSFCAHRDLTLNKIYRNPLDKVFQELQLFRDKGVKRVNIIDPIFNVGNQYLDILKEIDRLGFRDTTFTLQTRFELIKGKTGKDFLSLISKTNAHLEFGIQTVIPAEYEAIQRPNNPQHIAKLFNDLNECGISYEVSLIYGLPEQTVDSFKRSVEFVQDHGCTKIAAYPLMLLKGTELFDRKENWQMLEQPMGEFDIPVVTSSTTFDFDDWLEMDQIANSLMFNNRF